MEVALKIEFSFTNIMIHRIARKGVVSLYHFYNFHPLHKYFDISQVVAGEGAPLHILAVGREPETFGFLAQVAKY